MIIKWEGQLPRFREVMKLNVALVLLGLSVLPAYANVASRFIEVISDSNATLPCQMINGYNRCEWLHNGASIYSDHPADIYNPEGYAIVDDPNTGNCPLHITSVKLDDGGLWSCSIPFNKEKNSIEVTVIVPPSSNMLSLEGGKLLDHGEITIVKPDPTYGHVTVHCHSTKAKPPATIRWEVDGVAEESDEPPRSTLNNDSPTANISSSITLQYEVFIENSTSVYQLQPNSSNAKTVRCILEHKAYKQPVILTAVLQTEYATTTCELTVHHHRGNDSEMLLVCEANGIPVPSYTIQKLTPNTDIIESVFVGQNHTITDGGTYLCEATYQGSLSIQSNQVKIPIQEDHTTHSLTTAKTTRVWIRKINSASSIRPPSSVVSVLAFMPLKLVLFWTLGYY